MNSRVLFPILVFTVFLFDLKAQDPQFTQFYANPLYLNPAFAGTARCPRISMNYRNQWPNLSGRYVTYSFSGDLHVDALAGGLGILVTTDDQAHGTLKTTNASLVYSYQAVINREFSLKFGLQATYMQKSLDVQNLHFGDMIDARRGFVWNTREALPSQNKSNADFSVGVLGYSKNYFFGFAAHHLNQPDEGLLGSSKLPAKFTVHAGAIITLEKGNESYLSPNILFQSQQKFNQLNLGLYYVKGPFVAGLWYRNADAVIALIGIKNDNFQAGYSYDVTVSKLAGNTAGAHEISIQIKFECKTKRKKYRTISCPSF
ncbi:PorP/SprF family type IX secretion system membrane protein [Aurantibacillus circumpalustris]|uniref:PorP/SprF family type IX secretion system membrane protein n=1 Tax=Aurantibacillus circumpalustris TaxID=3036359 RepID=UPI00295AB1EB|nr:type IX secretion system membrane protein PorP/SprF [Aurantibacillus circumpalustris]